MRTRDAVPAGVGADPDADVTVVLRTTRPTCRASASGGRGRGAVRVQVVNRDGFEHDLGRRPARPPRRARRRGLGPLRLGRAGRRRRRAAGEAARTFTVACPADAFALWLGDAGTGDQAAATVVELERGPRPAACARTTPTRPAPLHQAIDADGRLWVALAGIDAVARLTPGRRPVPHRDRSGPDPGRPPQPDERPRRRSAPADVAVDGRGIVWTTLTLGNADRAHRPGAVARRHDGRRHGLPAAGLRRRRSARAPFPPEPGAPPTRLPLQMEVSAGRRGQHARSGSRRPAPTGSACCAWRRTAASSARRTSPAAAGRRSASALDAAGDVWFTEGVDNRLGRLTPDASRRPGAAAAAALRHYAIPSAVRDRGAGARAAAPS